MVTGTTNILTMVRTDRITDRQFIVLTDLQDTTMSQDIMDQGIITKNTDLIVFITVDRQLWLDYK